MGEFDSMNDAASSLDGVSSAQLPYDQESHLKDSIGDTWVIRNRNPTTQQQPLCLRLRICIQENHVV